MCPPTSGAGSLYPLRGNASVPPQIPTPGPFFVLIYGFPVDFCVRSDVTRLPRLDIHYLVELSLQFLSYYKQEQKIKKPSPNLNKTLSKSMNWIMAKRYPFPPLLPSLTQSMNHFEVHRLTPAPALLAKINISQRHSGGERSAVLQTPACRERWVVMADGAPPFNHPSKKMSSRGLISQTSSLPTSPRCFHSITRAIAGRWGPLNKDKAAIISPLACLDTFRSRTETRSGFQTRFRCGKASFIFIRKSHNYIPPTRTTNSKFSHRQSDVSGRRRKPGA